MRLLVQGLRRALHSADGPFQLEASFTLAPGEAAAVFGRSGSGKSTLLRILAGLTRAQSGDIAADGAPWLDGGRVVVAARARRIGFVFQDGALFPNMTVEENLHFALRPGQDGRAADAMLETAGLSGLARRSPASLSGGQRQRVALARALVNEPELLLLDEPLSALDEDSRLELQDELLRLLARRPVTTLLVSHDRAEISRLCRRLFVLERGRLREVDALPAPLRR